MWNMHVCRIALYVAALTPFDNILDVFDSASETGEGLLNTL